MLAEATIFPDILDGFSNYHVPPQIDSKEPVDRGVGITSAWVEMAAVVSKHLLLFPCLPVLIVSWLVRSDPSLSLPLIP